MQLKTVMQNWDIRDMFGRPQKKYRKIKKAYFRALKNRLKRFLDKYDEKGNGT